MTRKQARHREILIVGAGPVGLTAAVELNRRGFATRIIEADAGPHRESRALAINPRTLDILEPSGASEKFLAAGRKARAVNFHGPNGPLFRLETRNIPHPRRDYMLVLPQADTERLLLETLGGEDRVEWNTRLATLSLKTGKPVVTLRRHGKNERVTPDIVIGTDGANSTVRKEIGIGFAGAAYEHDWGLADVRLSGLAPEELHVFDLSPDLVAFIGIRETLFRAVADRPDVLDMIPSHITVKAVEWESQFRISHRQVETYQMGPVFLAGDAAHIHSPVGGRGMNLGIEDAAWLAWLIERGETGRYTAERHPVARRVLAEVDRATRFISSDGRFATFLRRRILPLFAARNFAQRRALKQIAGLASPAPPWLQGPVG